MLRSLHGLFSEAPVILLLHLPVLLTPPISMSTLLEMDMTVRSYDVSLGDVIIASDLSHISNRLALYYYDHLYR